MTKAKNLAEKDLSFSNLSGTDLAEADLRKAKLTDADVGDWSHLEAARLDGASGLHDGDRDARRASEPGTISGHQHDVVDVVPPTDAARNDHGPDSPA